MGEDARMGEDACTGEDACMGENARTGEDAHTDEDGASERANTQGVHMRAYVHQGACRACGRCALAVEADVRALGCTQQHKTGVGGSAHQGVGSW